MNDAAYAEARWAELQNQGDLAWDLDAITNRSEAIAFLKRFENRLCIYSAYVEKLYSNYSFVIPESDHGGITILPSGAPAGGRCRRCCPSVGSRSGSAPVDNPWC